MTISWPSIYELFKKRGTIELTHQNESTTGDFAGETYDPSAINNSMSSK